MYFALNLDNGFSKKRKYPYFSISSMNVNYILPQNLKICIFHVCLHIEGMVFFQNSSNFWMFSSLNIHLILYKKSTQ